MAAEDGAGAEVSVGEDQEAREETEEIAGEDGVRRRRGARGVRMAVVRRRRNGGGLWSERTSKPVKERGGGGV